MGDTLTHLHTVMVDKCDAERNAIKAVFGDAVRVRLCYWHLMYADLLTNSAVTPMYGALQLSVFVRVTAVLVDLFVIYIVECGHGRVRT